MMAQVNHHDSTHVSEFPANPTQPGSKRGVFWLVTVCLFLCVAALIHFETIPGDWVYPHQWLCWILPPLWFAPIIMSDVRADPRRSDAKRLIDDLARVIAIMFSIIVFSFFSACSIQMTFLPCRCAGCLHRPKFEEFVNDTSGVSDEQPVLPIHSLGDQ